MATYTLSYKINVLSIPPLKEWAFRTIFVIHNLLAYFLIHKKYIHMSQFLQENEHNFPLLFVKQRYTVYIYYIKQKNLVNKLSFVIPTQIVCVS